MKYQDKKPRRRLLIAKPKTVPSDTGNDLDLPIVPATVLPDTLPENLPETLPESLPDVLPESSPCPQYSLPDNCLTSPSSNDFWSDDIYPTNDIDHFANFNNSDLNLWHDQSNLLASVDEHHPLTQEERSELYHLIDKSIQPDDGVQESAGTYMRHMKERFGMYHRYLQFTVYRRRREFDNRVLLAEVQKRASVQLDTVNKPMLNFGVSESLTDAIDFDKWVLGDDADMGTVLSIEHSLEVLPKNSEASSYLSPERPVKRSKANELVRRNS